MRVVTDLQSNDKLKAKTVTPGETILEIRDKNEVVGTVSTRESRNTARKVNKTSAEFLTQTVWQVLLLFLLLFGREIRSSKFELDATYISMR